MEEQNEDSIGPGGGEHHVKKEHIEGECLRQTDVPDPNPELEDHEALPHSEILDIFEEGLAKLVQDPLLCDLPIQVLLVLCFMLVMSAHTVNRFCLLDDIYFD